MYEIRNIKNSKDHLEIYKKFQQFAFILYSISYSLGNSVPYVSTAFVFVIWFINVANELLISCQLLCILVGKGRGGLFKGICLNDLDYLFHTSMPCSTEMLYIKLSQAH